MPDQTRTLRPGPQPRTLRTAAGQLLEPPTDWILLAPGDATLTRRVKAAGPAWTVQEKKRGKTFSLGVWAPRERIEALRAELAAERGTAGYAKTRAASLLRRQRTETQYVESFQQAVFDFLGMAPCYAELAQRLAAAVAEHATPVGSGTVARTRQIPIERRAEAAVIAWLRHQTTQYDEMKIARVKGKRRQVRRELAEQSRRMLEDYRRGKPVPAAICPLSRALDKPPAAASENSSTELSTADAPRRPVVRKTNPSPRKGSPRRADLG